MQLTVIFGIDNGQLAIIGETYVVQMGGRRCNRPQALATPSGRAGRSSTTFCIVRTRGAKGKQAESHRRERPMCRSAASQIQPVGTKRNHPPTCHSERSETESRNLPKWQILPCVGAFCYVVDSSTPLALRSE